jgi:ABC-type microcin C transport system duplicated ATPase subunit YejF
VLVLERGGVCEQGHIADILARPKHSYTRRLIMAAPRLPDARGA